MMARQQCNYAPMCWRAGAATPMPWPWLDQAVAKRETAAELRNSRCWIKALGNIDLDGALADCNRAIELSSQPATYFDSRALVQFRAGRIKEALADYDGALAIVPDIPASLFMRGMLRKRAGTGDGGVADLTAARTLYPSIDKSSRRYGLTP